ncbi:MAG: lactoylglutathione lyase [Gammaproteobacteria bacterium RIFCSPLOWO2_02_FULL_56_15]|nr:MAG: lactoylglutathione lyase [Gammaproteobacteria bacterium RIFCSPLOWO2_02_FULL_56_15]
MRIMHTMLRVVDLEQAKSFYRDTLGMQLLNEWEFPEGRFTLAFLGYGDARENSVLELTWNWDTNSYDKGNAYGHIAIGVPDVYAACEQIRRAGGTIVREAGPMKGGDKVLAFARDPDGYLIELLEDVAD